MPTQSSSANPLEKDILDWSRDVYDEAEKELADTREVRLAAKLIDYISGQQWSSKARFGRSRPTVNRIFRHFIEMAGLLTDIEPDFSVKFPSEDDTFSQMQELLNEMVPMWARNNDFESDLTQVVMWALLHTGWAKVYWDHTLNAGLGDNKFQDLGPLNVMTIGAGRKVQDDEVVICRYPVTLQSLYRTYPKELVDRVNPDLDSSSDGAGVDVMRPAKISEGKWAILPPTLKKMLGIKRVNQSRQTRFPKVMLKQFWYKDDKINEGSTTIPVGDPQFNWSYMVEPGMPIYPRGRFHIVAGGVVLQDHANPYWHGLFPFAKLRLIRVPWSTNGVSPLESMAMMSDIVNRINGGIMDMIRAAIEPKIMGPKIAFSQSVWDSLDPGAPGAKYQYNNNAPKAPEFVKPPELPSYVLTMKQDVEREQDATSGAAAMNQALNKKQVPGGDSIEMILGSKSIPVRFMGRGLQSFLTESGIMLVSNWMQFSTSKSRIAKFGVKGLTDADFEPFYGQFLPKGMEPERFVKQVTFEIRKGSLLSIEKNDEIQIGLVLRKMGDISRRSLLEKLGLSRAQIDKIESQLIEEAKQKIALAGMAGAVQHPGGHHK